jgi:hypothetical protein
MIDAGLLVPVDRAGAMARLAAVADQARDYAAATEVPNTRRAYQADWRDFAGWYAHARPSDSSSRHLAV